MDDKRPTSFTPYDTSSLSKEPWNCACGFHNAPIHIRCASCKVVKPEFARDPNVNGDADADDDADDEGDNMQALGAALVATTVATTTTTNPTATTADAAAQNTATNPSTATADAAPGATAAAATPVVLTGLVPASEYQQTVAYLECIRRVNDKVDTALAAAAAGTATATAAAPATKNDSKKKSGGGSAGQVAVRSAAVVDDKQPWICQECTFENPTSTVKCGDTILCAMCQAVKHTQPMPNASLMQAQHLALAAMMGVSMWTCKLCTLSNTMDKTWCDACGKMWVCPDTGHAYLENETTCACCGKNAKKQPNKPHSHAPAGYAAAAYAGAAATFTGNRDTGHMHPTMIQNFACENCGRTNTCNCWICMACSMTVNDYHQKSCKKCYAKRTSPTYDDNAAYMNSFHKDIAPPKCCSSCQAHVLECKCQACPMCLVKRRLFEVCTCWKCKYCHKLNLSGATCQKCALAPDEDLRNDDDYGNHAFDKHKVPLYTSRLPYWVCKFCKTQNETGQEQCKLCKGHHPRFKTWKCKCANETEHLISESFCPKCMLPAPK